MYDVCSCIDDKIYTIATKIGIKKKDKNNKQQQQQHLIIYNKTLGNLYIAHICQEKSDTNEQQIQHLE